MKNFTLSLIFGTEPNNSVERGRPQAALVGFLRGFAATAGPSRQTLGIYDIRTHSLQTIKITSLHPLLIFEP